MFINLDTDTTRYYLVHDKQTLYVDQITNQVDGYNCRLSKSIGQTVSVLVDPDTMTSEQGYVLVSQEEIIWRDQVRDLTDKLVSAVRSLYWLQSEISTGLDPYKALKVLVDTISTEHQVLDLYADRLGDLLFEKSRDYNRLIAKKD